LNSKGIVYGIPGNWDGGEAKFSFNKLKKEFHNFKDCHLRVVDVGDYSIIGYGFVNGVELLRYRKYAGKKRRDYLKNYTIYRRLTGKFDKLFRKAKARKKPIIFLCRTMPFNTRFDLIKNKKSPQHGMHLGSLIAPKMILKYKPLLFIGGHMHEYFGKSRLGKTIIIAAGFGREKNTLVELDKDRIVNIKFKS